EVAMGPHHAIGQLQLRSLVKDGAAARGPSHKTDAQARGLVQIDLSVDGLPVPERDRRRGPREEPDRWRADLVETAPKWGLVHRHVRGSVHRRGDEQTKRGHDDTARFVASGKLSALAASTGAGADARPASGRAGAPGWSRARRGRAAGPTPPRARSGPSRRRTRPASPSTPSPWARSSAPPRR